MTGMPAVTGHCTDGCLFSTYWDGVEICQACGLGRTLSVSRAPEVQHYALHDHDARASKTVYLSRLYRSFLSQTGPGSLLDIGCADGILMDIAAAEGWRVTGLDSCPDGDCRHTIIVGRFLDSNFCKRFDALTLIHSFEHMDQPRAVLQRCRSLIERDGRLLIVVPNFGGWWSRLMGSRWDWLNVADHRYHYTQKALTTLIEQAGFRVETCRTHSAFGPSVPEIILSEKGVFDWPGIRWRPVRSVLYRLSRLGGSFCNPIVDLVGQGAELEVLARPI